MQQQMMHWNLLCMLYVFLVHRPFILLSSYLCMHHVGLLSVFSHDLGSLPCCLFSSSYIPYSFSTFHWQPRSGQLAKFYIAFHQLRLWLHVFTVWLVQTSSFYLVISVQAPFCNVESCLDKSPCAIAYYMCHCLLRLN